MGKDKLVLAAKAAGYAMVNPDDCETLTGSPETSTKSHVELISKQEDRAVAHKLSVAQEWLGYFTARPAIR